MCKQWECSQEEHDLGANLLTCNESMSETFCWLQWNRGALCQLSAKHFLTSEATGTTWRKLIDAPRGWRWLTNQLSSQFREGVSASWLCVFPPSVELFDLCLNWEMTVALSYRDWNWWGDSEVSLNSCTGWLTGDDFPANSPYCFCILFPSAKSQRQLSFYYGHVFA